MHISLSEHKIAKVFPHSEEGKEEEIYFVPKTDFDLLRDSGIKKIDSQKCFDKTIRTDANEESGFIQIKAGYFIGLDWLVKGRHSIQIEPKLNEKLTEYFNKSVEKEDENEDSFKDSDTDNENLSEVDFLKILLEVMSQTKTAAEAGQIFKIYWNEPRISIPQKNDQLTPFLVIQFLQLLKTIVRKGLKKSYYKRQENLRNRVKGKILVGSHIKQNVFKNRFTHTLCEYQEFGIDNRENRFLKKVLVFCSAYIQNNAVAFHNNKADIEYILNYCRPAFEQVGNQLDNIHNIRLHRNPFFKEYEQAFEIGHYILKRLSYNISNTAKKEVELPPFWINMPLLFELYFYAKLLQANPDASSHIHFQFKTHGNHLDFLISRKDYQMIIDTKYKPAYQSGQIHQDIRQVSGYGRLMKVREKLGLSNDIDTVIDCLIIYPTFKNGLEDFHLNKINSEMKKSPIKAYYKVYKLGIELPLIKLDEN